MTPVPRLRRRALRSTRHLVPRGGVTRSSSAPAGPRQNLATWRMFVGTAQRSVRKILGVILARVHSDV